MFGIKCWCIIKSKCVILGMSCPLTLQRTTTANIVATLETLRQHLKKKETETNVGVCIKLELYPGVWHLEIII